MNELRSFTYSVPPQYVDAINQIVANDEGGWILTQNKNDPGGATFGGMTYLNFAAVMTRYGERISLETFCAVAQSTGEQYIQLKYRAIQAYFDLFITGSILLLSELASWPQLPMLSCAINLGMDDVIKIVQIMCNEWVSVTKQVKVDGRWGPKTLEVVRLANTMNLPLAMKKKFFLSEWQKSYINIVQANCDAWEQYAELQAKALGTYAGQKEFEQPKFKRWKNLEGWFNRVSNYGT